MDDPSKRPPSHDLDPQSEQFLTRLIQKKVAHIIGPAGFRRGDEQDIENELRLKVTKHLSAYRGDKGHLFAFLTALVERKAANMRRDETAEKRDSRRVVSLSAQVKIEDEGTADLGATITQREADARLGRQTRGAEATSDLRHDIEAMFRLLTPDERKVCEGLKYSSITEVSRETGVPRATVYEMIARWRELFQDHNLHEYL